MKNFVSLMKLIHMPVSMGMTWMTISKTTAGASRAKGSHQPFGRFLRPLGRVLALGRVLSGGCRDSEAVVFVDIRALPIREEVETRVAARLGPGDPPTRRPASPST